MVAAASRLWAASPNSVRVARRHSGDVLAHGERGAVGLVEPRGGRRARRVEHALRLSPDLCSRAAGAVWLRPEVLIRPPLSTLLRRAREAAVDRSDLARWTPSDGELFAREEPTMVTGALWFHAHPAQAMLDAYELGP